MMSIPPPFFDENLLRRSEVLFQERLQAIRTTISRNFAILLVLQWVAAIFVAAFISPYTWSGAVPEVHPHSWLALWLGALITLPPAWLALNRPAESSTRQAVAIGQALMSALLIHLTGGRMETHFHIFGSLAFLAFYRDWKVLATASAIVAADHFLRGIYFPFSVYGTVGASSWRWLEHGGWVIFEDIFLIVSIRQSRAEMRDVAHQQVQLELSKQTIEGEMAVVARQREELAQENEEHRRTAAALHLSEKRFRDLIHALPAAVYTCDAEGRITSYNQAAVTLWGREPRLGQELWDGSLRMFDPNGVQIPLDQCPMAETIRTGKSVRGRELLIQRPDGSRSYVLPYPDPLFDESGALIGAVKMLVDITDRRAAESRMQDLNQKMLDLSRQAGMAEVATSVLHNVGNVLNSANVSLEIASSKVRQLRSSGLTRLADLLKAQAADLPGFIATSPQGKQLPTFISQLAEHFTAEQALVLDELKSLRANVEHINEIVSMQQSYASAGGFVEVLPLHDIVEDAIRMNTGALDRHGAELGRDFDFSLPPVPVDRHRVLQILVNLIRNAKYAMDDHDGPHKFLTIRTERTNRHTATISVIDTGIGIPLENMTRIFAHGFTTRANGHGYGLHSSALAAKEMGGSLHAQSPGLGHGATFTLELPLPSES